MSEPVDIRWVQFEKCLQYALDEGWLALHVEPWPSPKEKRLAYVRDSSNEPNIGQPTLKGSMPLSWVLIGEPK